MAAKQKMVRIACFWGSVIVPSNVSVAHATALAYIAWKGGVYEDQFKTPFKRWFRKFAEKHPELVTVKVFDVYPVDEFRFTGEYDTDSSGPERAPADEECAVRSILV